MRFLILLCISLGLSIGLVESVIDHIPDTSKYNHLNGDKVSIYHGDLQPRPMKKRSLHFKRNNLKYIKQSMEKRDFPILVQYAAPPETEAPPADNADKSDTTNQPTKLSNGEVVKPGAADIEETDIFDPEEDPDDVGPPPVVNGVAVAREE